MKLLKHLTILFFTSLILLPISYNEDQGLLLAHGDHFEIICRNDGLVDFHHIVLLTANITANVTAQPTYSFEGEIIGQVSYACDPEVHEHKVLYSSENGRSIIEASFSATLKPLKFTRIKLYYTVKGLLNEVNGTWYFRYRINTESASPPEIVLKIPKPSMFHKLIIDSAVPSPQVFIEESHYYDLIWKSPLFIFGNTSTTYIDVSYRIVWDWESFIYWFLLTVGSGFIGFIIGLIPKRIKRFVLTIKKKISLKMTTNR